MEETFEEKIIRNVQGNFAIYKTTEVVGSKSNTPNIEWAESDEVDKFFAFARNLAAKVIYLTEADEEDEQGNIRNSIIQVGFLHQGIMHHINLVEEEDEDEDEQEEEEDEDEDEEVEESETQNSNNNSYQEPSKPINQNPQVNNQNQFGQQQQQPPQQQQQQPPSDFINQRQF